MKRELEEEKVKELKATILAFKEPGYDEANLNGRDLESLREEVEELQTQVGQAKAEILTLVPVLYGSKIPTDLTKDSLAKKKNLTELSKRLDQLRQEDQGRKDLISQISKLDPARNEKGQLNDLTLDVLRKQLQ